MEKDLIEVTEKPIFGTLNSNKENSIKEKVIEYLKNLKKDFATAMDELVCDGIIKEYGLVNKNSKKR